MLRRTLVLSAVNVVTVLLVFIPLVRVTAAGSVDALYIHSTSPAYLFFIQAGLGIFAVVIDMLNRKPHLQTKLLTAAVALSATLAGVVLWLVFDADNYHSASEYTVETGTWLPLLNVFLFAIVWYDQRKNHTP
jgi:hypothetical protein